MAGYTRQSAADIVSGEPINAGPLNTEFNQLQSAFSGSTGHTHSGGSGDGPQLSLTTAVSGYLPAANGGVGGKNNVTATTAPGVSNDTTQGYAVGSRWINTTTDLAYVCVDASTGAAIWNREVVVNSAGTSITVGALLSNVTTPSASTDAATKAYVDAFAFSSSLPGQAGNAGKYVTTDGSSASWANLPSASETVVGTAEIATQAETNTGTDDARIVTPLKLASRTATDTRAGVVELSTDAEAATGSDTTRALTPANLTAAGIKQGLHTLSVAGGALTPRTTNGPGEYSAETTTNKVMITGLAFDAATTEYAQFIVPMPISWNEGTVTFDVQWTAASGSGGVAWAIRARAFSDDDPLDGAFGTAVVVTDTLLAANDLHNTATSSALTIAGSPAAGDVVIFEVYRDVANGSDTLAVDAVLISLRVFMTINAATD